MYHDLASCVFNKRSFVIAEVVELDDGGCSAECNLYSSK